MAAPNITPNPEEPHDAGHIPLTEEIDSSKYTMPHAAPVIGAILLVGLALAIIAWVWRAKPVAEGSITSVYAAEIPRQHSSLVAVQMKIKNITDKPIILKNVVVSARGGWGENNDDFAPATDVPRYFAAFPALQEHSTPQLLTREQKIAPGETVNGTVIVSFPLTEGDIQARQSMEATVNFYDHHPVVLH